MGSDRNADSHEGPHQTPSGDHFDVYWSKGKGQSGTDEGGSDRKGWHWFHPTAADTPGLNTPHEGGPHPTSLAAFGEAASYHGTNTKASGRRVFHAPEGAEKDTAFNLKRVHGVTEGDYVSRDKNPLKDNSHLLSKIREGEKRLKKGGFAFKK